MGETVAEDAGVDDGLAVEAGTSTSRPDVGPVRYDDLDGEHFSTFRNCWDHRALTYCVRRAANGLTLAETRTELGRAVREFETVDGVEVSPYRYTEVACDAPHDIDMDFRVDDAGGALTCASTTLGWASGPGSGTIRFNNCVNWQTGDAGFVGASGSSSAGGGTVSLWRVGVHEVGHAMGLDHTDVPGSVMTPAINAAWSHLSDDDRLGVAAIVAHCVSCPTPGLTRCGLACVDAATDRAHCGRCGNACGGEEACLVGHCACPAGASACGGRCVALDRDPLHCGACDHPCPSPMACGGGVCACPAGSMMCAGRCVIVGADPQHCLGCGMPCAGGQVCDGGRCVTVCAAGQTNCADRCVDLTGDLGHCGACGRRCEAGAHASAACARGACELRCDAGWRDVDRVPANGCECRAFEAEACNGRDDTCDGRVDEGCPTGVATRLRATSPQFGGAGGAPFDLGCPTGWAATGVEGSASDRMERLSVECRRATFTRDESADDLYAVGFQAGGCTRTILLDAPQVRSCTLRAPILGGAGGTPFAFACPPDSAITRVDVSQGGGISTVGSLRFYCGRFQVFRSAGAFAIRTAPSAMSNTYGAVRPTQTTIEAGNAGFITRVFGRQGASLDAIGASSAELYFTF